MDEQTIPEQSTDVRARPEAKPADFPPVEEKPRGAVPRSIASLGDVNVNLSIRLGTSRILVKDIFQLRNGSVVELDKLAGEQVDIYVNDVFFASGEVVVIGDSLGVRVTEIAGQEESERDEG